MSKRVKVLALIAGLLVVIGGVAVAYSQSENLQGFLRVKFKPSVVQNSKLYTYRNKIVTLVVSPVTSTVPSKVGSNVTSQGGTSKVTSVVPSTVTTPVASAVAAPKTMTAGIDVKTVQKLTSEILMQAAKADYKAYPSKYKLSTQERARLLQMYNKASMRK